LAVAEVYTTMSFSNAMRALIQSSWEGPRHLQHVADAPVPRPGRGEILVRVAAAGVNFADISRAYGSFRGGPRPPFVAGFEAAGEVVAVGDDVSRPERGAIVVGVGVGAFAEYVVMPAASAMMVPRGWSAAEALGLVVSCPAALAALKHLGRIAAGETVLIHAAAGATGQAAVKIAKHYGATIIAAASPSKHEAVRALGVDHVLDSRSEGLAAQVLKLTGGVGADLVLESVGGATFGASLAAARRVTGRVVVLGLAGGKATVTNWDLVYEHQVQVIGLNLGVMIQAAPQLFGAVMGELFALIGAGVLGPVQPTTYALADGAQALAALESRATIGKLALLP
jgi:NADPH:quinone reductase